LNINQLIHQLSDEENLEVRRFIPDKLAKIGDLSAINPLGKILVDSYEPAIMRNEAAESLGKIGDSMAIEYLLSVLNDEDPELRRTAVWSLGQIGDANLVDVIADKFDDNDFKVRRWVVKSLGRIRTPKIFDRLEKIDERNSDTIILTEILRSVTTQRDMIDSVDHWMNRAKNVVRKEYDKSVKQAALLLLQELFSLYPDEDLRFIDDMQEIITHDDTLLFPLVLNILGITSNYNILLNYSNELSHELIIAFGHANMKKQLFQILKDDEASLNSVLEALFFTDTQFNVDEYLNNSDFDIRNNALRIHAKQQKDFSIIKSTIKRGLGINAIISTLQFYSIDGLELLSELIDSKDKGNRQMAIRTLKSPRMLSQKELVPKIRDLLLKNCGNERIWHIRRDARIGVEMCDKLLLSDNPI
jgi:hypothetical protein